MKLIPLLFPAIGIICGYSYVVYSMMVMSAVMWPVLILLYHVTIVLLSCDCHVMQAVCSTLGGVLAALMLIPFGWLLADIVLVARFQIEPAPRPSFVILLYLLGYGELCIYNMVY